MVKASWYRDWQFGVAFVAAPVVWVALYLMDHPQLSLWWLQAPLLFLSLAIIRPLLEEIVFRGLLQGWCIQQPWGSVSYAGVTTANVFTSTVFTALHFIYHPPLMAAAVLLPSLVFGYFRDRYSGWLVPRIVLPCFYHAGYFMLYQPQSAL